MEEEKRTTEEENILSHPREMHSRCRNKRHLCSHRKRPVENAEERAEEQTRVGWGKGPVGGWGLKMMFLCIASGDNVGVTEERLNWVTRLVSSTRLKHPLTA